MAQKDIKKCRYCYCKHENREIDISAEEYKVDKKMYYHPDCYKAKLEGEWKDKQTKADIQLIKNLWVENISHTVVYSRLYGELNKLLVQGIESGYLVFIVQYCINNNLNLRYPAGIKYFADNEEIKNAYKKIQRKKRKIDSSAFTAVDTDDAPEFSFKSSSNGFEKILGGG